MGVTVLQVVHADVLRARGKAVEAAVTAICVP